MQSVFSMRAFSSAVPLQKLATIGGQLRSEGSSASAHFSMTRSTPEGTGTALLDGACKIIQRRFRRSRLLAGIGGRLQLGLDRLLLFGRQFVETLDVLAEIGQRPQRLPPTSIEGARIETARPAWPSLPARVRPREP